jgi:hypothetical protein
MMEQIQVTKPRQEEDEEGQEQEQDHMKGQKDPRCLKCRERIAYLSGRISKAERDCQAVRREDGIIHHL